MPGTEVIEAINKLSVIAVVDEGIMVEGVEITVDVEIMMMMAHADMVMDIIKKAMVADMDMVTTDGNQTQIKKSPPGKSGGLFY
jgi:ketopantoate hydroxymethyltransferase